MITLLLTTCKTTIGANAPVYRSGVTVLPNYTQVVVDMIDPNYKSEDDNSNRGIWNDNVTGYTIKQIEDVLPDTSSWNEWKNNLKNKYDNDTEENLDRLFRAYE